MLESEPILMRTAFAACVPLEKLLEINTGFAGPGQTLAAAQARGKIWSVFFRRFAPRVRAVRLPASVQHHRSRQPHQRQRRAEIDRKRAIAHHYLVLARIRSE